MSLYGALYSGVSGLSAQSSAMGAIADNISNVNTTGYKGTTVTFSTLVTKQTSTTKYSPGGVQSNSKANIDLQGLLSSSSSSTDLGISGEGFFVVNQAPNPGDGDLWGYTRAGSFTMDDNGYLKNDAGYYIQAWPLMPSDGEATASIVNVNDISYMKAYNDEAGLTTYINDNIIDSRNLQPVNLNDIGGTATPTKQIRMGANLPSSDPIFDVNNANAGGTHGVATLIYDSLGNAHNINFQYTKESSNSWGVDVEMPEGASVLVVYGDRENTVDGEDDVYGARGQLEFDTIPDNHTYIKITNATGEANEQTYVYEFTTDGTTSYVPQAGEVVIPVDMQTGVVSTLDAVEKLQDAIYNSIPSGGRFSVDGTTIAIEQSPGGAALSLDASHCLQCVQSAANPSSSTGIPTGQFNIPEIDWELKNAGRIDFSSSDPADYVGTTITIGSNVYQFTNAGLPAIDTGNIEIDLASAIDGLGVLQKADAVNLMSAALTANATDASRFVASGTSIEIYQSETGEPIMISTGDIDKLDFDDTVAASTYDTQTITINGVNFIFDATGALSGDQYVDISSYVASGTGQDVLNALYSHMVNLYDEGSLTFNPYSVSVKGDTLITRAGDVSVAPASATPIVTTATGIGNTAIDGMVRADNSPSGGTSLASSPVVIGDDFTYNGVLSAEDGTVAAAVRFNSDGTPKYFNVSNISIEWANGAEDMTGAGDEGSKIDVFLGNTDTNDGLTTLAGDFSTNYIKQDGAKFGNFAGVTIGEDGIVTALFDNGETRPIGMIPVATFVNANGLQALTGNTWIETDYSGQPVLREAASGGAGSIQAGTLESSTVDIASEFTSMITTQRAYSAASKIITTADEMLDELINIKR